MPASARSRRRSHASGVREQHPDQGDLGEELDGLGLHLGGDRRRGVQEQTGTHEHDGSGQLGLLQPPRQRPPGEHRRRDQGDRACRHSSIAPGRAHRGLTRQG